ncbi:MAG: ATP synthase F1 subunit gamma [Candidatus Omnitrophica bacterium]|nr:ATP synthase F1 subunit gamma [Candidatus Omnitrophota bacterium]MDD5670213.1 ATP synthase F1 subunit gamma [Candidatus Omnitrophota bacterium]
MSGQLRNLRKRIRSVESTKKITRAMEMVSTAKLKRFQNKVAQAKPFLEGLERLVQRLSQNQQAFKNAASGKTAGTVLHPFFAGREEKQNALILVTSDTGLCGSYNHDLAGLARKFIQEQKKLPILLAIGKTGIAALKQAGYECHKSWSRVRTDQLPAMFGELKTEIENIFLQNKADAVYVISSHMLGKTTYKADSIKLLPFAAPKEDSQQPATASDLIYEPSPEIIFEKLIPVYFEAKIRMLFFEAYISEQLARMNAMHQATKNAEEMIDSLVLLRNKIRQATITNEIIEVASGSKALKR